MRFDRPIRTVCLTVVMAFAVAPVFGQGADDDEKPEPPLELLLEQSRATRSSGLTPGLEHKLVAVPAFGLHIHTFVFDDDLFSIRTAEQKSATGSMIGEFLDRDGDVFAIDGGFFEKDRQGRLTPSGLLVVDGALVAPLHERAGSGILHTGEGSATISYRKSAPSPDTMDSAVQVGPVLVDPGGKVGIYSNQGDRRRRSALCLRPDEIVAVVVDGDGLSLFQLAHMLAIPVEEGGIGCYVAINLDGGPSTQAVYRGTGRDIEIEGKSTVQNALVVSRTSR